MLGDLKGFGAMFRITKVKGIEKTTTPPPPPFGKNSQIILYIDWWAQFVELIIGTGWENVGIFIDFLQTRFERKVWSMRILAL